MTLTQITEKGIKDGEIINADINASAAIAGSKISPNFGSQNIVTTGSITGADLEIDSGTLSVDASNNRVGITTTSPRTELDLSQGQLSFSHRADYSVRFYNGNNNNWSSINNPKAADGGATNHSELEFRTATGVAMHMSTDGKIGVGTQNPSSKIDIHCGSDNTGLQITSTDAGAFASYFDNTGASTIGHSGTELQLSCDPAGSVGSSAIVFQVDNNNERMRLDSSGRLLIGTTTEGQAAADNLTVADTGNSGITIRSGDANNGAIYFSDGTSGSAEYKGAVRYSHADNNLGFYANGSEYLKLSSTGRLELRNSSGNIRMSFENSGGLNFITSNSGEEIKVSSGNGDANGIEFWDYTGVNKRCQIDGHGIKFNADTAAANALDDYEEGTFTPSFGFANDNFNGSYSFQQGYYTKIGRIVNVAFQINANKGTATGGTAQIYNLPFTAINADGARASGSVGYFEGFTCAKPIMILVEQNQTQFPLRFGGGVTNATSVNTNHMSTNFRIYVSITYTAA